MSASPRSSRARTAAGAYASARAQRYRMNVGTIVEADMIKVRLAEARAAAARRPARRTVGEVEEFIGT